MSEHVCEASCAHTIDVGPSYGLIDRMGEGVNELSCTCGERLYPDCDVSAASIVETFEQHLAEAHGIGSAS